MLLPSRRLRHGQSSFTIEAESRRRGGDGMSVVKVIELVADSPDGWKDAIDKAVSKASETIHNITGVEVKNLTATVQNGRVVEYKADLHLAFRVDE